jgi:hypothetical protein
MDERRPLSENASQDEGIGVAVGLSPSDLGSALVGPIPPDKHGEVNNTFEGVP